MKKKFIGLMIGALITIIICVFCVKPIFNSINYGLDLKGGFEVLYLVESLDGKKLNNDDLTSTYKSIVNRIDTLGVSEPEITIEGDKIRVKLPGVKNEESARERLSTPAVLTFRNSGDELLMSSNILGTPGAKLDYDSTGKTVVALNIKDNDTFYNATKKISKSEDQLIVIWLDFEDGVNSFINETETCGVDGNLKCISAATVTEAFMNNVVITGNFTKEEATNLVELINSGSLPTKLTEISTKTVDATFGSDTLRLAGIAGLMTILIITIIMSIIYRLSGFISSVCLVLYSLIVFALFNAIGGVLTLTGIAALILGVGMAVDSSVVTIEKIKDELRDKKSLEKAFKLGNKRSLVSLIDSNITTFIAAIILFIFGESSVKGFATMLMLTIIITMLTMVLFNRIVLKKFIDSRFFDNKTKLFLGNVRNQKDRNYMRLGIPYIIVTCVIVIIGGIFLFTNKVNLGIDFSGGTSINVRTEENIEDEDLFTIFKNYDISSIKKINDNESEIKLNDVLTEEQMKDVKEELSLNNYNSDISVISTIVKKDLTKNAFKALVYATIGILIYIAIRFTPTFALSSVVALISDVLVTVSLFIIFKIEIDFIFIAAILTIIGYSINDTIVIFDMIRENKNIIFKNVINTKEELEKLVNVTIKKALTRSIITTITTLIAVVILLILGIREINTFNLALMFGLIAGCLSTLYTATKVWIILETRKLNRPIKKEKDLDDELEEKIIKGINS